MPVPSLLSDLTNDPATNSPQGTESAKGVVDDYLRAHGAFIRQLNDELKGLTVALPSASTVNIGFAKSVNIAITGIATVNAFDVAAEGTLRYVQFRGAMTLKHNAAVIALPGSADIVTTSGDNAVFKSLGGGKWECLLYQYKSGSLGKGGGTITGDLSVNGQSLLKDGTAASPALAFTTDTDTGIFKSGDGIMSVVCNGIVVGRFLPTGFEAIKVVQTA